MKTNRKQNFLNTAVGCFGAFTLLAAPHALAFPSTGTCGMLATQPIAYGQTLPATNGLNILATITFTSATTGTMSAYAVNALYQTGGPAVASSGVFLNNQAFTLAAGPIAGSMTLTAGGQIMNLYAVNGDKTILVQGQSDLLTGVCQF